MIWIARNSDGTLALFYEKPIRKKTHFDESESGYMKGWIGYLDDDMYPEVTWENSPKELTIKRRREIQYGTKENNRKCGGRAKSLALT